MHFKAPRQLGNHRCHVPELLHWGGLGQKFFIEYFLAYILLEGVVSRHQQESKDLENFIR